MIISRTFVKDNFMYSKTFLNNISLDQQPPLIDTYFEQMDRQTTKGDWSQYINLVLFSTVELKAIPQNRQCNTFLKQAM